ncbi:phosphatidylinositol transfer protein csr1 [Coniosporium apollinis]|uniref:Phosphatidylinositol transfer protein csr1 n=1 Tax=Coniosporium apollinis TaxID=61459 RepID=A0ABQ9NL35_9PEZI|nr:phosphatidylinositol transfer protein csr1 [Coniosporium apollinis]
MPSQIQPGRPGNLTADQEAKLRELWALTLKVFGVTGERTSLDVPNGTATPTPASSESASLSTPDKKKKGRLSLFSKKHKDDNDGSSTASSGAATPTDLSTLSDEDDKHGQTKAYREALAKSSPEELRNAFWSMTKHDHPDGLLLRFLRARKWDVGAALVMLISTMHWRATEMHVDSDIMAKGELGMMDETRSASAAERKEGEDFISQMRMGKSFLHGIDREGRPMCFVRVRLHRQGEQSEASLERFTVYTIETARMLLRPPVDTATIVFDMTNFSMSNMDYTPVKFMIKCFEANYPESLGAVLVHKSPWIFQGIWNIIRGWLDPVVAGKVHFTKNVEELETYVPRTQIPRELGGDEDWEYRYVEPQPGENDAMKDVQSRQRLVEEREGLVRRYEELLLDWIGGGGEAAGRSEERNRIAEELRRNYWNLDPYVRARSLYDRTGVIQRGGALQFYPPPRREVVTSSDDLD